ncbi:MAG: hypothetical protein LQ345_006036 [Seirophora villosa]|nr:MAG: hypothetical protein LQ345_006036 [Seirophora villosa]
MASFSFDIDGTEQELACKNFKLLTCFCFHVTVPNSSSTYQTPQELIAARLWITRGNALDFSVRLALDGIAGSNLQLESFANSLSDILCAARASRIHSTPEGAPSCGLFDLNLALSHFESSSGSLQHTKGVFASTTNIQDTRPPPGIPIAFLDSIRLTFTLQPLFLLKRSLRVSSRKDNGSERKSNHTRYRLRSKRALRCEEDTSSPSDRPNPTDKFSGAPTLLVNDIEILEPHQGAADSLLFSDLGTQSMCSNLSPPLLAQNLPPTPRCLQLDLLDVLNIIDVSLHQVISGSPTHTRSYKRLATNDDIKLLRVCRNLSLADISPAQFRPGYMKAIAIRAPLISRIASSISTTSSRSRSCTQCLWPPQPQPEPQVSSNATTTASILRTQLWALLQNHKWPTTPLETFKCTQITVSERCEMAKAMMFDSDDVAPITNPPKRRRKEDDEDMLDTPGVDGCEMLDDEEDKSLFRSFETSNSSQGSDMEMIFDNEDDYVEEYSLLGEEASEEPWLVVPRTTRNDFLPCLQKSYASRYPWLAGRQREAEDDKFADLGYNTNELFQEADVQLLF